MCVCACCRGLLTACADIDLHGPPTLQALLSKLTLPEAVLSSIQQSFTPGSLLIARSSANVEDLAGELGLMHLYPLTVPADLFACCLFAVYPLLQRSFCSACCVCVPFPHVAGHV